MNLLHSGGACAGAQLFLGQACLPCDDRQQIVEIMRYTTGQPPNSLHLLGLAQLTFEVVLSGHHLRDSFQRFFRRERVLDKIPSLGFQHQSALRTFGQFGHLTVKADEPLVDRTQLTVCLAQFL